MNRFKILDSGFRNKVLILILTTFFLLLTSTLLARAQEAFVGPGGCTSKEECRSYCDEDNHKEECLTFAEEHGLMSREEVERARKFIGQTGPGGCRGDECRDYCEDPHNREECISFAEKNGLIRPEEAERFRKFKEIEEKGGPGGCKGQECRHYCEDKSHHEECFTFAKEHGLIGEEEIKHYETGLKIREKIKTAGGPGGCTSENECHEYCSDIEHVEECVAFGAEHSGKSQNEVRGMLEEFKRHKDQFEKMHQNRREEFESDFSDREFEDGEFQKNFQMVPPEAIEGKNHQRSPTTEEIERIKEKYHENYEKYQGMMPPEGQTFPEGYTNPSMYPKPETYREQYPQEYQPQQYQTPPTNTSEPTFAPTTFEPAPPPPSEPAPQPTSYDHSKSFLANMAAAFMTPFRK